MAVVVQGLQHVAGKRAQFGEGRDERYVHVEENVAAFQGQGSWMISPTGAMHERP